MESIAARVQRTIRHGDTTVLVAVFAVLAARLLLALTLIPPWQHPDEPTHVGRVELQRSLLLRLGATPETAREAEILESMTSYDWWAHRGMRAPSPSVIHQGFGRVARGAVVPVGDGGDHPLYHRALAGVLAWVPPLTVVQDMYVIRGVSALLGLLTLWVIWLGSREFLGRFGGIVTTTLAALHPQFAIVSTQAAPDAMTNLLGACVWWQAALTIKRRNPMFPLAILWAAAIAAVAVDRMGAPLLAVACLVSLARMGLVASLSRREAALAALGAAALLTIGIAAGSRALGAFGDTYQLQQVFSQEWTPVAEALTGQFFTEFTLWLHESWWLSLGWVRYTAPEWWTMIAAAVTLVAALGIGPHLLRTDDAHSRARLLVIVAALGIAIQVAAVYWTFFRLGVGAQGRYLFPCLVPSLVLFWSGIEAWAPRSRRIHAAVALVTLFGLLDAAAWMLVAIPAYAS